MSTWVNMRKHKSLDTFPYIYELGSERLCFSALDFYWSAWEFCEHLAHSQDKSKRPLGSFDLRVRSLPARIGLPLGNAAQRCVFDREDGRRRGAISYGSIIAVAGTRSSIFEDKAGCSFRSHRAFFWVRRLACTSGLHTLDFCFCAVCPAPWPCLQKRHEARRRRDD